MILVVWGYLGMGKAQYRTPLAVPKNGASSYLDIIIFCQLGNTMKYKSHGKM